MPEKLLEIYLSLRLVGMLCGGGAAVVMLAVSVWAFLSERR